MQLDRLDPDGFFGFQAKVIQSYFKKDFPATLRLSEAWAKRHRNPVAIAGYGMALVLNGRAEEGIPQLELALRLSPRDTYRAEWQYRLALAHFVLEQYEQARDWGQTAEASNPGLPWPPVHAAALLKLGQKAEARLVVDGFLKRNPTYVAGNIIQRLPASHPRFVAGRDRLVADLRELGMP